MPHLDARGGHLVSVSSAAVLFGLPWHAACSATRFDLRHHGIGRVANGRRTAALRE